MLRSLNVEIRLNTEVFLNQKTFDNYDYVVVCTYDQNNYNLRNLNFIRKPKYHYQLVEKIIVYPPKIFLNKSFVILDGSFVCIDPYEKKNCSILGSVKKSIITSKNSQFHNFNNLPSIQKYFFKNKNLNVFFNIKKDFEKYFLDFKNTKYYKSFFVVRATKKNINDERLTKIENNKKLITVFSGKWVNCISNANKIVDMLK
jgi:hypothetical protein